MPRFFIDYLPKDVITIIGEDAKHITRSLRMQPGEAVTINDQCGHDYHCVIQSVEADAVLLKVQEAVSCVTEPTVRVRLYQALAKSDKFEWIVQKCVELGVSEIVPVYTKRCVSVPDSKSMAKKVARYQKIAFEAAKQSGRGRIPQILDAVLFKDAVQQMQKDDIRLLFYEKGGKKLSSLLKEFQTLSYMIGPEGGFDPDEVEYAKQAGVQIAGLGNRILRCETAPVCALSVIMYQSGNL